MGEDLDRYFGPELARVLAEAGRRGHAPSGQGLFAAGASCGQYLVLLSGVVRVQAVSPAGREIVLYRVLPGQGCAMTTACLLGQCRYSADGVAETDITFMTISDRDFERLVVQSQAFRTFVFGSLGARLAELMGRVEDVALERIDVRLARFLLRQAEKGSVGMTHQQIAADLGSAREVVSRRLKLFEQQGRVALERGRVVIVDPAALEKCAGGV